MHVQEQRQPLGRRLLGGVVAVLFLLLPGLSVGAAESTPSRAITVALDDNYPPYIFRNSAGDIDGYLVDVWRLWEKKTGIQVTLAATDWAKAQQMLAEGQAEVIDTMFRTPEREKRLAFSRPYADLPVPIYVHQSIGGINEASALRGFLVGAKAGDACIEILHKSGVDNIATYASYEALVNAAVASQVRIFCLDEPPANYLLYRKGVDQQFHKAFVLYSGQFHRAVMQGNEAILKQVEQGFAQISVNEYKEIYSKWMGTPLLAQPWLKNLSYLLAATLVLVAGIAIWGILLRREVRLRTHQLNDERLHLRTLIDTVPDLVWLKDPEGVFLSCNAEFEKFYGAKEQQIVGKTDYDFSSRELADFFRAKDQAAIAAGKPTRNEESVTYASDGHQAVLDTLKTPMFDSQGRLIGVLGVARDITAQRQVAKEIEEMQERFMMAFQASPVAASIARLSDGRFVDVNESYQRLMGWSRDEMVGKTALELGFWRCVEDREEWLARLQEGGRSADQEIVCFGRDGARREVSVAATFIHFSGETHILAYLIDISARNKREENARLAAKVFESTAEGIMITDVDGRILSVNRAFTEVTGYPADEVLGNTPRLLRSGRHEPVFYQEMWASLIHQGQWQGEIWNRRKNGEVFPNWEVVSRVQDEHGQASHYVAVFSDISAFKHSQEEMEFLAHHDPLTELPNRILFRDRLKHALTRHQRERGQLAVMFLDLDRFKHINDTLGHPVGDEILRQAARLMVAVLRSGDTIARIGGDEFVILLEDDVSVRSVNSVAQKLVAVFAEPFQVSQHKLHITASIGISLFPHDGDSIDTLLMHADLAMYKAKEQGRNNFQFYESDMGAGAFERMVVENALRGAVSRGEFLLHYQPQIDLMTGVLAGVEALVRWQHPQLGLVMPGRFIPVAEEMGLIGELGDWVIREACRQMGHWQEAGFFVPRVAVNLSMQQLEKDGLVEMVSSCLADYRLPPERLELEVTESVLMRQTGRVLDALNGLRRHGVYLAVDDFGTGYSSLAYLRQLPVHRLKIDYSFVRDIGRDTNDEVIARAIIGLGRSLGMDVVAEGVERDEQADFLRREHCQVAQGYLFAYPQAADEIEAAWNKPASDPS